MSIRTIKIPYIARNSSELNRIKEYCQNYTNLLRFTYNRITDLKKRGISKPSTKELFEKQKGMNNIFLDSWFKASAIYDGKALATLSDKVIFGGRKSFLERCQRKITNGQWKEKALMPIYSVGEASKIGNRKFQILSENKVVFQPSSKEHFELTLPRLNKNLKRDILKLMSMQNEKKIPITYKLDLENIYISFENNDVQGMKLSNKIKDRVFSIDLNPNYIGWTVVDWMDSQNYRIIDSGVISNKNLNDMDKPLKGKGYSSSHPKRQYISNKRKFENIDSANFLVAKAIHYQCEIFAIEDLKIENSDKGKGKNFNRLCNNLWNRTILVNQLQKKCDLAQMKLLRVYANYSSFMGNLIYRKENLPDMCLSSIEIGRRGYEFHHQYILKDKQTEKNIIFDTSEKSHEAMLLSLEELGIADRFKDVPELFGILKTRKMRYRVPIENSKLKIGFSKKSTKSRVILYNLL